MEREDIPLRHELTASADTAGGTSRALLRKAWLVVGLCAALVLIDLVRHPDEQPFCADLRRIDGPVAALRQARAADDFTDVPTLLTAVGDAYRSVDPPPEIRAEWTTAIEYLDLLADDARAVQLQQPRRSLSADDRARYAAAMTSVTELAVSTCPGRVPSTLIP